MKRLTLRLAQRILGAIIMILAVATFTFFLVHMLPGNPIAAREQQLLMEGIPPQQVESSVQSTYGFTTQQSLPVQYEHYMVQLFHFDLGKSISYSSVPVSHLLASALPWTVIMVLLGIIVSFVIGVTFGVIAALKRSSPMGNSITLFASFLHGIPQYILALVLVYFLATRLTIFPYGAPYDATLSQGWNWPFLLSLGSHAILPIACYALSGYGGWVLTMKSTVVSTMGDDFILAAELRGITPWIRFRYIARNAILPLFTVLAISLGFMFGGAIFIEQIFDYPGLGSMLLNSLGARDYPLMMGAFLLITTAVIFSNLIADMLYSVIDPRIRRRK